MMSLSRAVSSACPGSTICTTLLGSRMILLLAPPRHSPAALNMVSPLGKREMISRSTNRLQAASFTPRRRPMLRPNINSATCPDRWPPRQFKTCASTPPASAKVRVRARVQVDATRAMARHRKAIKETERTARADSISAKAALPAEALDGGPACRELVFQPLEAAIEMIDAVDDRLTFGRKRGDDEGDRGA